MSLYRNRVAPWETLVRYDPDRKRSAARSDGEPGPPRGADAPLSRRLGVLFGTVAGNGSRFARRNPVPKGGSRVVLALPDLSRQGARPCLAPREVRPQRRRPPRVPRRRAVLAFRHGARDATRAAPNQARRPARSDLRPPRPYGIPPPPDEAPPERCRGSGVEHPLGKGEVESSNLSGSTIFSIVFQGIMAHWPSALVCKSMRNKARQCILAREMRAKCA
jgi:hypothetical protein